MATLTPFWLQQFFDDNGDPLASGKVYAFESGTTTPKLTYTTQAATVNQPHPVPLDAAGRVNSTYGTAIWLGSGSYTLELRNSAGTVIRTINDVTASGSLSNGDTVATIAALKAYSTTGLTNGDMVFVAAYNTSGDGGHGWFRWDSDDTSAGDDILIVDPSASGAGRWYRIFDDSYIDVRWAGAKGDGATNDYAAIVAADAAAYTAGKYLKMVRGVYKINSVISFTCGGLYMEPNARMLWTGEFNPTLPLLVGGDDYTYHFDTSIPAASYPTITKAAAVRPEWFGAVADGNTDCTYAITMAQNSVATNGGEVRFAPGTYLHTSALTVRSYTVWRGAGALSTSLARNEASGNGLVLDDSTNTVNAVTLTGFRIFSSGGSTGYGLFCDINATQVKIEDVNITGYRCGAWIYAATNISIDSCKFTGQGDDVAGGIGLRLGKDDDATYNTSRVVAASNVRIASYEKGYYGDKANGVALVSCHFYDCATCAYISTPTTFVTPRFEEWTTGGVIECYTSTGSGTTYGQATVVAPYAYDGAAVVSDILPYCTGQFINVIYADKQTAMAIADDYLLKYYSYSDTVTNRPTLQLLKSHQDTQGNTATVDTESLGAVEFIGVTDVTKDFVKAAGVEAMQDGAAGQTYVGAKVQVSCGSNTAAPASMAVVSVPATAYNTSLSLTFNDNTGVGAAPSAVVVGAADSGGAGFRLLRIANDDATDYLTATTPTWHKYTMTRTQYNDLGGSAGAVTVFQLPTYGFIHAVVFNIQGAGNTWAASGASAIVGKLANAGGDVVYNNLDLTVQGTIYTALGYARLANFAVAEDIKLTVTVTGADLITLSQGTVDIYVLLSKAV